MLNNESGKELSKGSSFSLAVQVHLVLVLLEKFYILKNEALITKISARQVC